MESVEPAIHRFLFSALDRPDIRLKVIKSNEIQERVSLLAYMRLFVDMRAPSAHRRRRAR